MHILWRYAIARTLIHAWASKVERRVRGPQNAKKGHPEG